MQLKREKSNNDFGAMQSQSINNVSCSNTLRWNIIVYYIFILFSFFIVFLSSKDAVFCRTKTKYMNEDKWYVISAKGEFQVISVNGANQKTEVGMNIDRGDKIKTSDNSIVVIKMQGQNFIRLLPNTISSVKILKINSNDEIEKVKILHEKGTVYFQFKQPHDKDDMMEVQVAETEFKTDARNFLSSIDSTEDKEDNKSSLSISMYDSNTCIIYLNKKDCYTSPNKLIIKEQQAQPLLAPLDEYEIKLWKKELFVSKNNFIKGKFLEIIEPKNAEYFDIPTITVSGRAAKGANVSISAKNIKLDSEGQFDDKITLYEGKNTIVAKAVWDDGVAIVVKSSVFLDVSPPLLLVTQPVEPVSPAEFGNCVRNKCYINILGFTEPGVILKINKKDVTKYLEKDGTFLIHEFPIENDETVLIFEAEDEGHKKNSLTLKIQPPFDADKDGIPDLLDPCPNDSSPGCNY